MTRTTSISISRARRSCGSREELAGCSGGTPDKDPNTALFRIDVIKVPLAAPQEAKIVSSPRIFTDPRTGAINGLWNGGNHDKAPRSRPTPTSATTSRSIRPSASPPEPAPATASCSTSRIPSPKRIDAVSDPNYSFWHSATFNNDGTKVLFTDEWGGGGQPRCRATDPMNWGADAIFTLKDDKLTLASYYKMPAPRAPTENCVAHNGSLVPVPGRDIEVQAWYQGGISVMDFTDASHPYEIAYFDRGPLDPKNAHSRRRLVGVLVQRLHLRLGDRPRRGRLQTGANEES